MQYFGFDRPSFGIKTLGFGSSEFSPLDLFAGGKQGVWYDPSDKSTLFQDVAGAVPVTKDGDPVALMRDKSGNGNHATQSVSTARPVYKTDGILHWLEFDGADDFLTLPTEFLGGKNFYTSIAHTNTSLALSTLFSGSGIGLNSSIAIRYNKPGNINFGYYSNDLNSLVTTTSGVKSFYQSSTGRGIRENSKELIKDLNTTYVLNQPISHIGATQGTLYFYKGSIYNFILVTGEISESNMKKTEDYQSEAMGVTI